MTDISAGGVLLLRPSRVRFRTWRLSPVKLERCICSIATSLSQVAPSGSLTRFLDTKTIAPCWCGPSYFTGSDGIGRVVGASGCHGCTPIGGASLAQITIC